MKVEGIEAVLWKIAYRSALEAMGKDELTSADMKHYARTISDALEEETCEIELHCTIGGFREIFCYSCSTCGHWWNVTESDGHFKYCPYCGRRVTDGA